MNVRLAQTLIAPLFDYGDVIYGGISHKDSMILQRLQNSAMRSVLNANRYMHITDMLDELKLMPLKERREFRTCLEVYKGYITSQPHLSIKYLNQLAIQPI